MMLTAHPTSLARPQTRGSMMQANRSSIMGRSFMFTARACRPRSLIQASARANSSNGDFAPQAPLLPVPVEQKEHVAIRVAKMALLMPVFLSVVWTGPAHAAKKSRQAAAAQIVQETAPSTASPLEQLQARLQGMWQQVTGKSSQAAEEAGVQAQATAEEASTLQQKLAVELEKPEVRKGLAAAAVLFLVMFAFSASSGKKTEDASASSKTDAAVTDAKKSDSDSGGNSNSAAAPAFASSNGRTPAAAAGLAAATAAAKSAAPATPVAAPRAQPKAPAKAQERGPSPQELLKAVTESANKVNAAAAATASEVSATAAAATAAARQAEAVAAKAQATLAAVKAETPRAPSPPKIVKPEMHVATASKPTGTSAPAAAAAPRASSPAGSRSSTDRSASPPPVGKLPNKGAATPALAVLGAGAVILDLMSPFANLAVSSLTGNNRNGARKVTGATSSSSSAASNGAGASSSNGVAADGSSNGVAAAVTSRAAPAASAPQPEPEPIPERPKTPSKLELAAAAAVAANAASTPRGTLIELPVVTLDELEQAVGASARK